MQAVFRKDIADRMLRISRKLKPKFQDDERYHDRWLKLYSYMRSNSKYLKIQDLEEVKSQMSDADVITMSPWLEETIFLARREGEAIGIEKGIQTLLRILTKKIFQMFTNWCAMSAGDLIFAWNFRRKLRRRGHRLRPSSCRDVCNVRKPPHRPISPTRKRSRFCSHHKARRK